MIGRLFRRRRDRINEFGSEIVDPTPVAAPLQFTRPETQFEQIRRLIRSEQLAQEAAAAGFETPDEADDFEVGDDFDPTTPYEEHFFPPPAAEELPVKPGATNLKTPPSEETPPAPTAGAAAPGTPPETSS